MKHIVFQLDMISDPHSNVSSTLLIYYPKDFLYWQQQQQLQKSEMDIKEQMGGNINIIRGNLLRDNFKLFVIHVNSEDEKLIWLGQNLEKLPGIGILYTGTRVDTEIYAKWFEFININCSAYNAGLDSETRIAIENGLMNNQWKMHILPMPLVWDIDKQDIRFIHSHTKYHNHPFIITKRLEELEETIFLLT